RYAQYSGCSRVHSKRYGNMIASRFSLNPIQLRCKEKPPWPQLLAQVLLSISGRKVVVVTAHIPNGSRNGWEKIDTFRALADLVREAKGRACVVTGDFNEPR